MNECDLHQMPNCATCLGLDLDSPGSNHNAGGTIQRWSDADRAVARRSDLSSREVADRIGRTTSHVSAYRIAHLQMTDWKDNFHRRPHTV